MRVLVADDDSVMRLLLERLLAGWGYSVVTASDGLAAIRQAESDPEIQILLLDWMMPELDGLEVCRRARALARKNYVYILLITSRSGKEDFLDGMSAGADDFLTKPVDADELRVRIRAAERVISLKTEVEIQAALSRQLREIDEMKTAFIHLTSHELRSPLCIIDGMLELLLRDLPSENEYLRSLVQAASDSAQRLTGLVEETLKVSREGPLLKSLKLEEVVAADLVREAVQVVAPFVEKRAQHIESSVQPAHTALRMDRNKIKDALINLLMNAIKFTQDGKTIRVSVASEDNGHVRFTVADPGVGVSEADRPHMFEECFSTLNIMHHSSGRYEFGTRGIGLGLAIVKQFVELHGGTVGFTTECGAGSSFYFTLPVNPAPV